MPKSDAGNRRPGYSIELQAGEIVQRGRPIVISAVAAVSPEAWRGVSVAGQRVNVRPLSDGRTAEVDTSTLPVGPHRLRVDELWSKRSGKRLPDNDIPFVIVDTAAPLPRDMTVQHAVRLRFDDLDVSRSRLSGSCEAGMVEVFKAEHRTTRKPVQLAFDSQGKRFDIDRAFAELAQRRFKVYGKVHPALYARAKAEKPGGVIPVAVWLRTPEFELPDKPVKGAVRRRPPAEAKAREAWKAAAGRFAEVAARHGMKVVRVDSSAPLVFGIVSAAGVAELAASGEVAAIFLHQTEGFDDLGNSIAIANADDAHTAGFTGTGINVAVYEQGPDDTSNLDIDDQFDSSPSTSQHSRHTHGIIKNIERNAPHGHAPDCNLHSANSYDLDALRWAVEDRGCTVISQSFHRDAEQTSSGLSFDDVYKDHLALHWPYPSICEAAGNGVDTEFVNHKGFNRLTVGNHNDAADAMASDSVFRNPASSHGDRELPEIAANGTGVTAVGLTLGGTSMAAPAVAGGVALIQQANATLRSWPEGCRAIMMAAAWRNPAGGTWRADVVAGVDAADGAGAIDTYAAVQIARARRGRNNTPARRGWDVGTVVSADIGADGFTTYVYRISVPRLVFSPTVKVALAWDSKITTLSFLGITLPIASTLAVDLDLHVRDASGATVASSASWDNSYEIAEFAARRGETYEIRIRRWSGTDNVWFGVAWEVRGVNFVIDRLAEATHIQLGPR